MIQWERLNLKHGMKFNTKKITIIFIAIFSVPEDNKLLQFLMTSSPALYPVHDSQPIT